jgi:dTDP-glucose 4,6-dehydratase
MLLRDRQDEAIGVIRRLLSGEDREQLAARLRAAADRAYDRFAEGLERTVAWYRDNRAWWEPIRSGDYRAYYERQYGRALG